MVGLPAGRSTGRPSSPAASGSGSTIARALVNNPAIVWADEPTGDLDSKNADEIMDLINEPQRASNGQTFVMVTHDIHVAERCFHIINMRDGEIVSESVTDRGRARAVGAVAR